MKDAQLINRKKTNSPAHSTWRGAYVNEHGEEVEITEHMIQRACNCLERELENHLLIPGAAKKSNPFGSGDVVISKQSGYEIK